MQNKPYRSSIEGEYFIYPRMMKNYETKIDTLESVDNGREQETQQHLVELWDELHKLKDPISTLEDYE